MDATGAAVSNIATISELLYDFGPGIVILSTFLMLFIVILFFIIRQQTSANDRIMKEHQILIEKLLHDSSETELFNRDLVNMYVKINSAIKLEIMTFINLLGADRLAIYVFHNGTTSLTGLPFLRFSCFTEYVKHSERSRIKSHNGIPVNLLSDFIKTLVTKSEIIYDDNTQENEYSEDVLLYNLITKSDDKYIIKAISDSNCNLIAFAVIEFDEDKLTHENCEDKKIKIDEMIKIISPILEFSNFNSMYKGGVSYET